MSFGLQLGIQLSTRGLLDQILSGVGPVVAPVTEGATVLFNGLEGLDFDGVPILGADLIGASPSWTTQSGWTLDAPNVLTGTGAANNRAVLNGTYADATTFVYEGDLSALSVGSFRPELASSGGGAADFDVAITEEGPFLRSITTTQLQDRFRLLSIDLFVGTVSNSVLRPAIATITAASAQNGTVTIQSGAGIVYTAPPGETSDVITYTITGPGGVSGTVQVDITITPRTAVIYYVSPTGNDANDGLTTGTAFRQPQAASDVALVGDTVNVAAGTYEAFEVMASGASGRPIVFNLDTAAIVEGALLEHVALGGAGAGAYDPANGILIENKNWITVNGGQVRNMWRCGVFVLGGAPGNPATGIIIDGLSAYQVGASAIRAEGQDSGTGTIPVGERNSPRLTDVTIRNCEVYFSNVPNDQITADTETISVAAGVSNVTIQGNTVGTATLNTTFGDATTGRSRGYGIDAKSGAQNVTIRNNTVFNHVKYGIYLDSSRRWSSGVDVYNNTIYNCDFGVVLAREAGEVNKTYAQSRLDLGAAEFVQELTDINIYNNTLYDIDRSLIYLQTHPRDDIEFGDGQINNISVRFNTGWNGARDVDANDFNLLGWDTLAAQPTNVDFVGNVAWNAEGAVTFQQDMSTIPAWLTYLHNSFDVDPLFTNTGATPPVLTLIQTSPAVNITVPISFAASPFDLDADGLVRIDPTFPGSRITLSAAADVVDVLTDGTFTSTVGDNEVHTIIITNSSEGFNGTYTQDVDGNNLTQTLFATGPAALLEPVVSGTAAVGEVLTVTQPALFLAAPGTQTLTRQWLRGGTPISGETGTTYTTALEDEGLNITVRETLVDANGTTSVDSNAIAIPAPATGLTVVWDALRTDDTDTTTYTFAGIPLTDEVAGDQLLITGSSRFWWNDTVNPTVNGNAVDFRLGRQGGANLGQSPCIYTLQASDIATGNVTIVVETAGDSGDRYMTLALARIKGGTVAQADLKSATVIGSDQPLTISHNVTVAGSAILSCVTADSTIENDPTPWGGGLVQSSQVRLKNSVVRVALDDAPATGTYTASYTPDEVETFVHVSALVVPN